jgi:peptidylprolyl isomerase
MLHKKKWFVPAFMIFVAAMAVGSAQDAAAPAGKAQTVAEVLAAAKAGEWRPLDPENTLYLELASGRVVIELAPLFAPLHAANVKSLAREKYYDGLAIIRVQDNYVVQWGDPNDENPEKARKILKAKATLPAEFDRPFDDRIPFTPLPDGDVFAPEVGFCGGFPVARDRKAGKMWLAHGYGMVGAARGNASDSGGGTQLYVVIGQAPRHLDRNITLLGRVVQGMELLSSLPRGGGAMGFYDQPEKMTPIRSICVAAGVPPAERSELELLRSESESFRKLIEARRNRCDDWFLFKAGRIDLGNMTVPVRDKKTTPAATAG